MVAASARASDHPLWLLSVSLAGSDDDDENVDEDVPASLERRSQAASAVGSMPKRAQTSGATQLLEEFRVWIRFLFVSFEFFLNFFEVV